MKIDPGRGELSRSTPPVTRGTASGTLLVRIRAALSGRLAPRMVPAAVEVLEELPRTQEGKVARGGAHGGGNNGAVMIPRMLPQSYCPPT